MPDRKTPREQANRRRAPYGFGKTDEHHPAMDRPAEVATRVTRSANEKREEARPAVSLMRLYAFASSVRGGELRGNVSPSDTMALRGIGCMGRSGFHKVVRKGLKINQFPRFGGFPKFPYLGSLSAHHPPLRRFFLFAWNPRCSLSLEEIPLWQ